MLPVVEEWQADSKSHVDDTDDDWHLHLVRVQKRELVVGQTPDLRSEGQNEEGCWSQARRHGWKFEECDVHTGSIPNGYGPLNAPGSAGSMDRKGVPAKTEELEGMKQNIDIENETRKKQSVRSLKKKQEGGSEISKVLTSKCSFRTWGQHATPSRTHWGLCWSTRCKWRRCRWRTGPSVGSGSVLQTSSSRSRKRVLLNQASNMIKDQKCSCCYKVIYCM